MIPNNEEGLYLRIETAPGQIEAHQIRAWDADSGGPLVLDPYGGLVAAKLLGTVRSVEGN